MITPRIDAREIRVATFDCYGTLIDWEGGMAAFLYGLALAAGDPQPEPGWALRQRWEAIQFELKDGPYRPYARVLAESVRLWMEERGYAWEETIAERVVRSMRSWQPFPDTRPALRRAHAAGLRLAIISNTDRDIIAHSLRHLDLPFEAVITGQDCEAYKPKLAPFERALAEIGEAPERVLHVAFGFKYDIGPARQLGFQTAWVNRHVEAPPGSAQPDHEWRDLWGLVDLLNGSQPLPDAAPR